jgi:hypothetical protein
MLRVNIPDNLQEVAPAPRVSIHPALGPDSWAMGYTFFVLDSDFLKDAANGIYGMCLCRMRGREFWFEQLGQLIPEGHLVAAKGLLSDGMANVGLTRAEPGEEIELALTEWHVSHPNRLRRTAFAKFRLPSQIQYPQSGGGNISMIPLNPDPSYEGNTYNGSRVFVIGSRLDLYMNDDQRILQEITSFGPQGINGIHLLGECFWFGAKEWQDGFYGRSPSPEFLATIKQIDQVCSRYNWKVHFWAYGKWPSRTSIPPQHLGSNWERHLWHEFKNVITPRNWSFGIGFDTWHDGWGKSGAWVDMMRQIFPESLVGIRNYEHGPFPLYPYDGFHVTLNEIEVPKPTNAQIEEATLLVPHPFFSDRFEVPGSPQWGRDFTVDELNQTIINCMENYADCTIGFRPSGISPLQGSAPLHPTTAATILVTQERLLVPEEPEVPEVPEVPETPLPKPPSLIQRIIQWVMSLFR